MFDYWDHCENKDIITPLIPGLQARDCFVQGEKILVPIADAYSSPWIHARLCTDRHCNRYQMIYHAAYRFIPRKCMECWKVVQRPRNLKELFEIYKFQRKLQVPSKCGIETRKTVHGNYGAYWYNNSKEAGFEQKEMILKEFPKIPTILKRGCTEFEMSHGPSDRWTPNPKIVAFEKKLDEVIVDVYRENAGVVKEEDGEPSPWYVDEHTKRR